MNVLKAARDDLATNDTEDSPENLAEPTAAVSPGLLGPIQEKNKTYDIETFKKVRKKSEVSVVMR